MIVSEKPFVWDTKENKLPESKIVEPISSWIFL